MAYLTLAEFKLRTAAPGQAVDDIEAVQSGWCSAQIVMVGAWVDARLAKRYAVPFASPVPEIVLQWVADIVTDRLLQRRGRDPMDADMASVKEAAERARAEIAEAANSENGLFELPLRQDLANSRAVVYGGTRVYSEASPYVGYTLQGVRAREEDANGGGTYG